jgi:hypothetical protein
MPLARNAAVLWRHSRSPPVEPAPPISNRLPIRVRPFTSVERSAFVRLSSSSTLGEGAILGGREAVGRWSRRRKRTPQFGVGIGAPRPDFARDAFGSGSPAALPIDDGRQAEGEDVNGPRRKQQVASHDAPTEQSFNHSAATDLESLLEVYARPDRRVLERRSPTPGTPPVGPNDRRVSDRRSPTAQTSPDSSNG